MDIEAKLQAGKGAGYARWSKVFSLKQTVQTMNFLTEHNLLEYVVQEEKTMAATARHNELSAEIKAIEKRMEEISVLQTQIINYAKTREVYVAYRKAGYSKKFREEYARLLEKKKKAYGECRRSRDEMRELLTVKTNVDRILSMEVEQKTEMEKDHDQR